MGGKCTAAADVYSLGVVLWELATQERPARGQMRDIECAGPLVAAARLADCYMPHAGPLHPAHSAAASEVPHLPRQVAR